MSTVATGVKTGVALYSPYKEFPEQLLGRTQPPIKVKITDRPSAEVEKQYYIVHGVHYVTLNLMDVRLIPKHVQGFEAYIRTLYNGQPDKRGEQILQTIHKTKMVIGVLIAPEQLDPRPALGLVSTIAEMIKGLQFINGTLIDYKDHVILAPDGKYDRAAIIDPTAPPKSWWQRWRS